MEQWVENVVFEFSTNPTFWGGTILCFALLPAIAGMIFGGAKDKPKDVVWMLRGVGVEISFVLLPFAYYAVGNSLNGSFGKFLTSPELPMAAMILFLMPLFAMLKGLAAGAKNDLAVEPFMVLTLVAIVLALCCGAYISWLAFKPDVPLKFGVWNSLLIVFAVLFAFAVNAAMAYLVKYPERFKNSDKPGL